MRFDQQQAMAQAANIGFAMQFKPPKHCERCGEGEPTEKWVGDSLGATHGFYQMWCKRCVARVQLRYALGRLRAIPKLLVRSIR